MAETVLESPVARSAGAAGAFGRPYTVALVAAALYTVLLAWLWAHFGGNPHGFIHEGTVWRDHNLSGSRGYDGQFYYYIALHPLHALPQLDLPTIRLQRILFPLLITAVSLHQAALMPYVMLGLNALACVAGTLLLAVLLRRWGRSPWFALSYGLAAGIPVALTFDTAEPLTFALVLLGIAYWEPRWPAGRAAVSAAAGRRWDTLLGAAALAAALLTRELAVYFVAGYGAAAVLRRDGRGLLWAGLTLVPVTLWGAFLSLLLGKTSLGEVQPFEQIPFITYWTQGNLVDPTWRSAGYAAQYIVPAAVFGLLGLGFLLRPGVVWLRRRRWLAPAPLLIALLGNVHLVTFVPHLGYQHQVAVSRYALGLALAAVLWAGSAKPRWLLWLTPLVALGLLGYVYGLITMDPAYLW